MAAEKRYHLTCTPGHVAVQFNQHGNCATVTVDTVVLGKLQAACISKITVELTAFLPCGLMNETEHNRVLQTFYGMRCQMQSFGTRPLKGGSGR